MRRSSSTGSSSTRPRGAAVGRQYPGSMVDLAVLVISAATTPYQLVRRAVEAIGPERMLGVVLNRVESAADADGYGYYDYYGDTRGVRTEAFGGGRAQQARPLGDTDVLAELARAHPDRGETACCPRRSHQRLPAAR